MALLTELVTKFDFKGSLDPLKNYNKSLGKSIKTLTVFAATTVAVGTAISALVLSTAEGAESQISLSKQTGISVEKLRELTFISKQFGISAGTVESSVSSLSKKIGEASISGSSDFERLGISVRDSGGHVKNVSTILTELRHSFTRLNLSAQQQTSFAEALGLDSNFIQVLDLTDSKFNHLTKTVRGLGVITEKQAESLESINQNMGLLHFSFNSLHNEIALSLAPAFKQLTDNINNFIQKHKHGIANFFLNLSKIISSLAETIKRVFPVFAALGTAFVVLKISALGFGDALKIIFTPFRLAFIAISAGILVIDDLIVAFDGGKSAIRAWIKDLTGIDITPMLRNLVADFEGAMHLIGKVLKRIPNDIEKSFTWMFSGIEKMFNKLKKWSLELAHFFGFVKDKTDVANSAIPQQFAHPMEKNNPYFFVPQKLATKSNSVNQNININIKSTDPKSAGLEVKKVLNDQLRYAKSQHSAGWI